MSSATDSETVEQQPNELDNPPYEPVFDVEVGRTVGEDRSDGTPYPMWRAEGSLPTEDDGETVMAESPEAAILAVIEKMESRWGDVL